MRVLIRILVRILLLRRIVVHRIGLGRLSLIIIFVTIVSGLLIVLRVGKKAFDSGVAKLIYTEASKTAGDQ